MTMNSWEIALLSAAAYVAIVTLVRLMRRRRDELIDQLAREVEAEKQRLRIEEKQKTRRKARDNVKQEEARSRRAA